MEDNRKHRSNKGSPLRALHFPQNNIIWKRKRSSNNTHENLGGHECTYTKRSKYNYHHQGMKNVSSCYGNKLATVNPVSMMELDTTHDGRGESHFVENCDYEHHRQRQGTRQFACIYCRKWSGSLEDFAWHLNQAHGIPAQVAKCIMNKVVNKRENSKSLSSNGIDKLINLKSNENVDVNAETFQAIKFIDAHYKCIPQVVLDHQQNLSDCE